MTSYCNAFCAYCPKTIYKDIWSNRHLDMEIFSRLIPFFKDTKLIYLQGWGEPFLNPNIFEMIKTCKDNGVMTGLTTNAMAIESSHIKKIIDLELDIIALSLTGIDEDNDSMRKGTIFTKVLSVIEEVKRQKERLKAHKPLVNIAYLLLKNDLDELYRLVDRLEGWGVNLIVVSGLDFVCSDSLLPYEVCYSDDDKDSLNQISQYASNKGLSLITNLSLSRQPHKVCTENVTRSLFVSSDGTVSPCVFMNLPINNYDLNQEPLKRTIFGSLRKDPLSEIWWSKDYVTFRKGFECGTYSDLCKKCRKLYLKPIP